MSVLFAGAALILLSSASSVVACMCGKASTCERFNFSDTIFVGKAVRVVPGSTGSFKTETTVFEITEMLVGENVRSLSVRNKSGFSCDAEFSIGESYLVFANGNQRDGFGTGFCSGNMPVTYASEQIAELRKLSGSSGDGRLMGTVLEESKKRPRDEARAPLKNVRLEITELSTGRKYASSTNAGGRYELAVPPGRYAVEAIAPVNLVHTALFQAEPMQVRSGGCVEGFFVFVNNSMVAGRLLDADGKPAPYVRVELVSVGAEKSYLGGESAESDANGYFSITEIPAGAYTLSVNFNSNPEPERPFPTTFYPGVNERAAGKVLEIGPGTRIEGITWRLPPPLAAKAISGSVIWEDGSPAAGAEIKLFDMAFPGFYAGCSLVQNRDKVEHPNLTVNSTSFNLSGPACNLKSDANGKFALSGFAGRTYRLSASVRRTLDGQKREYEGESQPFSLDANTSGIKLVLRTK
ncbi:MAG TPA: carboxypeptidase regulatory-like domain-containing protein [Pyrinomonadaceae bacterium]